MKHNSHKLRADINRIAALQTEDINLKALRDRILIGYTYFLEPFSYLHCYMEKVENTYFLTAPEVGPANGHRYPIHPSIIKIFDDYNGEIPRIDPYETDNNLTTLFPDWKPKLINFNAPAIGSGIIKAEGLTDEQMDMLLFINLHLQAVLLEHNLAGYTANHQKPEYLKSKAALEEFFNNHPFFQHLRIRIAPQP